MRALSLLVPLLLPAVAVAAPAASSPTQPEILLTFDDGPHLERTPKVLDTLEKHHIHAVFFVNGWHFQGEGPVAVKSRELLREMIRRGHAVGNHTVHHLFLCGKRGPKLAPDEIEKNAELIAQAIGMRPELYRTPYGAHCKALSSTLKTLGVTHTGWDIDPQDWKVKDTRKVREFVISQIKHLHGRAIILFHDVHQDTVEALPQILDWLDEENARRAKAGEAQVKILDYSYLLPDRPPFPPMLDDLGRVLLSTMAPSQIERYLALAPLPST